MAEHRLPRAASGIINASVVRLNNGSMRWTSGGLFYLELHNPKPAEIAIEMIEM
jgi:hypothetical protein